MKIACCWRIFEKYSNIKFHETPSSDSWVVMFGQTNGQTDRRTEAIKLVPAFRNFIKTPKNIIFYVEMFENLFPILWYDMMWYITAIGLTPGGSSTVHIYAQTIHRIQRTERIQSQMLINFGYWGSNSRDLWFRLSGQSASTSRRHNRISSSFTHPRINSICFCLPTFP
jgi:hypothetical protein